jgi:hypothetical protein
LTILGALCYDGFMEFYNDSPATSFFVGGNVDLTANRPELLRRSVMLWMSFSFAQPQPSMNLSIYNDATRSYVANFKGGLNELPAFIEATEKDYNMVLPADLVDQATKFLAVKDQGFGFQREMDNDYDSNAYCETCGDYNRNEVLAFYFPAFSENSEASIGIGYDYGCYGGDKWVGDYGMMKDRVLEYAKTISPHAESRALKQIKKFIKRVKQL